MGCGSVPGWAALLPAGAGLSCGLWQPGAQAEHSHRGQLNAGIVSGPSLRGWERRWGAGRAECREVGGRDVQLFIWREESLRREEARFEAAEAVAKDAAL